MVINSKNKYGFTLIEAIVSLVIIAAVGALIIPFLNRNHEIKVQDTQTHGIFACYYNKTNNKLFQTLYENNALKEEKDVSNDGHCTFTQDKHAVRLYVAAVGAGSKTAPGQLVTLSTSQVGGNIKPGLYKSDSSEYGVNRLDAGKTIFDNFEVLPGVEYTNGLQFENMIPESSCKLIKAPVTCPEKCKVFADKIEKPIGCVLAKNEDNIPVIKILGCSCVDDDEFNVNAISLSKIQRDIDFLDRLDIKNLDAMRISQNKNIYKYTFNGSEFKFNFIMKDSNYDTRLNPEKYIGFSNMSSILSNLYVVRQNELVKKLININPGAPKKDGAVVIMW